MCILRYKISNPDEMPRADLLTLHAGKFCMRLVVCIFSFFQIYVFKKKSLLGIQLDSKSNFAPGGGGGGGVL